MKTIFTSESVTEGHPDKIADQISDAVLDAFLTEDKFSRVACEVLVNTGLVLVSGEITSAADYIDIQKISREKICELGYDTAQSCFNGKTCAVLTAIDEQSPEIAQGIIREKTDTSLQGAGAGDQGIMFGFACDETPEFMPLPISLAHKLAKNLASLRKEKVLDYLLPDGKTQVSIEYENGIPKRIDNIVISAQHRAEISRENLESDLREKLIFPTLKKWIDEKTKIYVNPTGSFIVGGPQGDCGLTGRKIIVDTYGGMARHGGGAFSGKDPSKVDRSGAYMARFLAKNLVANGLAKKCEVQLSYIIGRAEPASVFVETFGTSKHSPEQLEKIIRENFQLRPGEIIEQFDLLRPIYSQISCYGHFGRADLDLPWEKVVKI